MTELEINFEGYWQCRQATDPDPSQDPRGVSGYTYAFGNEGDLDLIIRLQLDEIHPEQNFRMRNPQSYYPPALLKAIKARSHDSDKCVTDPTSQAEQERQMFGVFVTSVKKTGGKALDKHAQSKMLGGKIRFMPSGETMQIDGVCQGPRYELRNEITYHRNDGIIMPIVPFEIKVEDRSGRQYLQRYDPLDLENDKKEIWEMDLKEYERRNPNNWFSDAAEVLDALGFDSNSDPNPQYNAYFQKRKEWLELKLCQANPSDEVTRSAYKGRLFALEFFTENRRIEGKLGLQACWDFDLHGVSKIRGLDKTLDITLKPKKPWNVKFWMGGFDGDVMRGYMRGTLTIPLES